MKDSKKKKKVFFPFQTSVIYIERGYYRLAHDQFGKKSGKIVLVDIVFHTFFFCIRNG